MDELTRERYPDAPDWERYRRPLPLGWRKRFPIADWKIIEERRRVLDEGLRRCLRRETSQESSDSGGPLA